MTKASRQDIVLNGSLFIRQPRHDVCNQVLNLLSQDGARSESSALAEAYRITLTNMSPFQMVLAQNACAASRAQ